MIDQNNKEPYINVWAGNFYKPAFDDEGFVQYSVKLAKRLGFNSFLLDAKAWEDFRDRYQGLEASQYLKMIEFTIKTLQEHGMSHEFLALYLNGDNLYPNIRFSPPIYGDSVVNPDGSNGKWYRYWSSKAQDSMMEHVQGLLTTYGENGTSVEVNGQIRKPICSMWDPIVAPSFDEEGIARYVDWLSGAYHDDIHAFNQKYGTSFTAFADLAPADYWYELAYRDEAMYTAEDVAGLAPKAVMWADNMKWRKEELCRYFESMQRRFKEWDESLYLCPNLAQWSYFLNIDGSLLSNVGFSDLWDTAMRGLDIYALAPYVDTAHFITVPVTPYGDADPYIVSCQHSMMRAMNDGRGFVGGIYWGRFLYNDIYATVTPCEIVGSIVASGAKGYTSYGMCGLDDGGVLHRMGEDFQDSLAAANQWAKRVIPMIQGNRRKDIALLFPSAMSTFEPMSVDGNKERRMDLLGWFKSCCDAGYSADIIDLVMIEKNYLDNYKVLIISANDCYLLEPNSEAEKRIRDWVHQGGILLHGPADKLVESALSIQGAAHELDCIQYGEGGLPQGSCFESFTGEEVHATYMKDQNGCVVSNPRGKGVVYSFGFYYGYSYSAKVAPHVPLEQKNNELYPIPMMKSDIAKDLIGRHLKPSCGFHQTNVETAVFDNGIVVVNHSSYPVLLKALVGQRHFQYPVNEDLLLPRTAVFIELFPAGQTS
ncbi:type 1 glutamine amidotransferase family protein [Paenibacillus hexagrammi]|uniref:Beta-galactosidase trimerisation domain-containing protein n=1 Tax=Paenibacillus hexagrammi TaxID=2908839 RepID=A0ABY3SD65_9BACL|nr:hypothetical protein [Paenibacillus sp. YPD9-1]UJF31425.1 hypothetical protein L0M14_16485 [Paenibacillus sp. YPD9-1]